MLEVMGLDLPKIESLGAVGNLKRGGVDLEIGGLPPFLLLYSSITFTLYVGKVKFPLLLQDSHPSLYSTKILYHLYILIHSGSVQKMLTALVNLEYTENYTDKFF